MTYVDPNGGAATWLRNNWFSVLTAATIAGVSYAFPVVGVTIAAISITHDLAEHNYTGLVLDTLGIVLPGISKLAGSGFRLSEAIDAAKDFHATLLLNFSEAVGSGSRQLSLAGGAGNVSYTAGKLTSESNHHQMISVDLEKHF